MADLDYRIHSVTHGLLTFQSAYRLLLDQIEPDSPLYGLANILDARLEQLIGPDFLEGLEIAHFRTHLATVKAA